MDYLLSYAVIRVSELTNRIIFVLDAKASKTSVPPVKLQKVAQVKVPAVARKTKRSSRK